ncbi:hypothetical protein NDU88_002905 [Pleurodeles waltl]|uniref:Uncharacterized protein n=1 Tax=Pleurodeles waltl TaxID=8319 RepID=A0AAV7W0N0_PLEWA|nr:hypothetical protein NDU88_002905 [Pleurodeles waltl]
MASKKGCVAWRRWRKKSLREAPDRNLPPRPILADSGPPAQPSVWLKVRGGSGTGCETTGPRGARGAKPESRVAECCEKIKMAFAVRETEPADRCSRKGQPGIA